MQGWIKLHRKIQDKGYYKKSHYVHLWIHLLLRANHKENEFMWNDKIIIVKEGQLITGRKQLSKETGISESSIERILKMLENEQQIEQQKTTKYRLVTILNWHDYQQGEQQNGQQADNKRTTSGQQTDTNKNDKNENNIKNDNNIQALWIRTWGRNPKIPEIEETEKLISKFGYDKVYLIMKESSFSFKNFKTLINALDDKGNIVAKGEKKELKTITLNN